MKIQMNKGISRPSFERASAPGIKKKGSMTIEAAFGIPLFLFAAVCLIWLIEIRCIRISVADAASGAAKNAAGYHTLLPVLNTIKLQSDLVSLIGKERLDRSLIRGGSSGISCWESYLSADTGDIRICVRYDIRLPFSLFGTPSAHLKEEFTVSGWMGDPGSESGGRNRDIVYVTDNGAVYHEDSRCSYLQLSIRLVPYREVEHLRNQSGGKYYPCEKCAVGTSMSGVYITEEGSGYHNTLSCSGLKRNVHAVRREDVSGKGGCSRCTH